MPVPASDKVRGEEGLQLEARILDTLSKKRRLRFTALREAVANPSKSTFHRVLERMEARGEVRREKKSHKKVIYLLGPSSIGISELQKSLGSFETMLEALEGAVKIGVERKNSARIFARVLNCLALVVKLEATSITADERARRLFFEVYLPRYLYEISELKEAMTNSDESYLMQRRILRQFKKETFALFGEFSSPGLGTLPEIKR